ncbi:MAG: hypothetical protein OEY37_12545, partial [Gammaproteobacteria bacterium]|nr:hypothetical protein [Gammaproteobacteria bacterium]
MSPISSRVPAVADPEGEEVTLRWALRAESGDYRTGGDLRHALPDIDGVVVAWQNPANNWGDQDGGIDLAGASAVEVWARSEYGGEKVTFGVGLLGTDRDYPDSAIEKTDTIELTSNWQRFRVSLEGRDLSSLKTGFVVTPQGRRSPMTIYLDSIRFVRQSAVIEVAVPSTLVPGSNPGSFPASAQTVCHETRQSGPEKL